ncbi:MAG TPA: fumarylacetoacetate hydrolase family protein [Fimbriimonas sp.]|nr:fumarylacetoacetate hydrolase family protein [Fimbriimonas sp.]
MILSRHRTPSGPRWFSNQKALNVTLSDLLAVRRDRMRKMLDELSPDTLENVDHLAPIDDQQEVWAAGVTYLRSRDERKAESTVADVYDRVYDADRPELFFKSPGWRAAGQSGKIRIRRDSDWNVPEPELTLVINRFGEIVGYTAGNDVSSRAIEGENPLYLPQAKVYDGSCAIGPSIVLTGRDEMERLPIRCSIQRGDSVVFEGESNVVQMKRSLQELVSFLTKETSFPHGVFLMTGTGVVPDQGFTLLFGDVVTVGVGELELVNEVDHNL